MKRLGAWIPNVWAHPISAIGTIVTTVSALSMIFLMLTGWAGANENIYAAGVMLFILPVLFVLGLLMIPFGLWRARKNDPEHARPYTAGEALAAAFQTQRGRRKVLVIAGLTVVNFLILAIAGHHTKTYMDSPGFCGTACHTVMQPEYATYIASPHARVACVDCHIGPGASFAVKSKIDGLRQVWRTLTNTYDRPVPTPVHTLRPSRDTCEQCHWPDKFHGSRLLERTHIESDEENSRTVSLIVLKVGGHDAASDTYQGIHWHVSPDHEVRYEALDEKREIIGKITVLEKGKVVREYLRTPDDAGDTGDAGNVGNTGDKVYETRTMDCLDCHNRPTHVFDQTPAAALDRAFGAGLLDRAVPWLREVAEPLLARNDLSRETAEATFRKDLEAAYAEKHQDSMPDAAALDASAEALAGLWRHNIYPARAVVWGTYPTHLGHRSETPERHGCYRCHGSQHKTSDGKSLSQSCSLCHEVLAMEDDPEDLDEGVAALLK